MSDLISRQKISYAVESLGEDYISQYKILMLINQMPSAEPERKKGKWIEIYWSEPDPNVCCTSYAMQSAKCSICGKYYTTPYLHRLVYFPYCPNCGADMRGNDGTNKN